MASVEDSEFSFDDIVVPLRRGDAVRWLAVLDTVIPFVDFLSDGFTSSTLRQMAGELRVLLGEDET